MQLGELLGAVAPAETRGDVDVEVAGIAYDSRRVEPGDLFVAQRGRRYDGTAFLDEAVRRGAVAAVGENPGPPAGLQLPYIVVANASLALSQLSAAIHGFPARRLGTIGVTGTDGKTTTVHMISAILEAASIPSGRISTVDVAIGGHSLPNESDHTTPQAPDIHRALAENLKAGARFAVVETSSHSLVRNRVADCEFDVGVITNISPEHLDFHRDFAHYREDKARLFRMLGISVDKGLPKFGALNADDPEFRYFRSACPVEVVTYGIEANADVRASDLRDHQRGMSFRLDVPGDAAEAEGGLIGRFNVYNWLAAVAATWRLGVPLEAATRAITDFTPVPGRLQLVNVGQPFAVVVDFAHTPNGLDAVLATLRARTPERLLCVFGHPGGRDTRNRPTMAKVAARQCDQFIITGDDPYDEDPARIIRQIENGAIEIGLRRGEQYLVIEDRREAMRHALSVARAGDTVLIAGRGHERHMKFGATALPFEDAAVAREILVDLRGQTTA